MSISVEDLAALRSKGNIVLEEVDKFDSLLGKLRPLLRGDDIQTPELLQLLEDLALLSQKISSMFGTMSTSVFTVWKEKRDPLLLLSKIVEAGK